MNEKTMADMEVDRLERQVDRHRYLYYVVGRPVISDAAYDAMEKELKRLRPNSPVLHVVAHPDAAVDTDVPHPSRMGSIEFVRTIEDFMKWYDDHAGGRDLVMTPKVDGLAIRKEYRDGMLVRASTRGDGMTGKDVTINAIHAKGIVSELNAGSGAHLEERGEVFMPKAVIEQLNAALPDDKKYANCRNAAAGSLRLHDPSESAKRRLHMMAYDLREGVAEVCSTEHEKAELAKRLGITYVPLVVIRGAGISGRDKFVKLIKATVEMWETSLRAKLPYDIDGLVFAIDDLDHQRSLGMIGGKSPLGKLAFKFASEVEATPVREVLWQTGRGGKVTPVAEFEPIQLMGSTVRRATLHNRDNVQRLGIVPGTVILIEKCGDIIPGLVKDGGVISGSGVPVIPEYCPACGGPTCDDAAFLMCNNPECSGQTEGRLMQFCRKTGMKGFGRSVCSQLVDAGIDDYVKLLKARLPEFKLADIVGKTAEKLVNEIVGLKEIKLADFLGALAIKTMDSSKAELLAEEFRTLEAVLEATEAELQDRVNLVGEKTSKTIWRGLRKHHARIREAVRYVRVLDYERQAGALTGKSFCVTGTLSIGKTAAKALIEEAGGKWMTSVGARTDYLVVPGPEWTSTKVARASKLGVTIIAEGILRAFIKNGIEEGD